MSPIFCSLRATWKVKILIVFCLHVHNFWTPNKWNWVKVCDREHVKLALQEVSFSSRCWIFWFLPVLTRCVDNMFKFSLSERIKYFSSLPVSCLWMVCNHWTNKISKILIAPNSTRITKSTYRWNQAQIGFAILSIYHWNITASSNCRVYNIH